MQRPGLYRKVLICIFAYLCLCVPVYLCICCRRHEYKKRIPRGRWDLQLNSGLASGDRKWMTLKRSGCGVTGTATLRFFPFHPLTFQAPADCAPPPIARCPCDQTSCSFQGWAYARITNRVLHPGCTTAFLSGSMRRAALVI